MLYFLTEPIFNAELHDGYFLNRGIIRLYYLSKKRNTSDDGIWWYLKDNFLQFSIKIYVVGTL